MTPDTPAESGSLPRSSEVIAGGIVFAMGIAMAAAAVFYGQGIAIALVTNPLISGVLWPVVVLGVTLFALVGMFLTLMLLFGVVSSYAYPRLLDRTGFSIIGAGGITGAVAATAVSVLASAAIMPEATTMMPQGTGESLGLLALIAVPVGGVFYELWQFGEAAIGHMQQYRGEDRPDPEVVREKRRYVAEDADRTAPPAVPPTPPSSQQHAQEERSEPERRATVDFDDMEYRWVTETDVSFDDIGGMDELKDELTIDVIKPLTTGKEKAEALGIPLPNILFHGPPGTGKTFTAEALATELGLPFTKLSGSDITSKWINESSQKIATLFEEAKIVADSEGGAVVFLDEIDTVLKARSGAGRSHEEDNKVTNEFLNHLQDTGEHDILFIGATNRMDALDDAGVRSGRIDKTIYVGKPDREGREEILRAQLSDRPNNLASKHIEYVARATEGMVAADIESIVIDAARRSAFGRDSDRIKWEDMHDAIENAMQPD
jgi:SpoVK/Ycf46/Vps4 family AAA+-type ATPase